MEKPKPFVVDEESVERLVRGIIEVIKKNHKAGIYRSKKKWRPSKKS